MKALRRRRHQPKDEGQALVLVMVLAAILTVALATTLTSSVASLAQSGQYSSSNQALLASQSGIAAQIAGMRGASAYTALPCTLSRTLSVGGVTSSYSVTASYYLGSIALTCSGTGSTLGGASPPTSAKLTSVGTAPHGKTSITRADVSIATSETFGPQFNYAIFTEQNLFLSGAANLQDYGTYVPNVYAGETITCGTGVSSQGGLTTQLPITLSGNCHIGGDLVSAGAVSMPSGSPYVGGSVTSYATGISIAGGSQIGQNATETAGPITVSSGTIGGNADASGAITAPLGAIKGTQTPFDPSLAGKTAPAPINWPVIQPGPNSFPVDWNVIQIPGNGYDCTSSGPSNYFVSNSDGSADAFMTAISTATQKTVIYAPSCDLTYTRSHTFALNNDVVLIVKTANFGGQNLFESTSPSTPHDFSVLASTDQTCPDSNTTLTFSNQTEFYPPTTGQAIGGLNVFLYTPGVVSYANNPSMTGLVLSCGGFSGTQGFGLFFSPVAAEEIPGSGTPLPPTVTVEDKYLSH